MNLLLISFHNLFLYIFSKDILSESWLMLLKYSFFIDINKYYNDFQIFIIIINSIQFFAKLIFSTYYTFNNKF